MSIQSKSNITGKDIQTAAIFLLTVVPCDELLPDMSNLVKRYRQNNITKQEALNILLTGFKRELKQFIITNIILND